MYEAFLGRGAVSVQSSDPRLLLIITELDNPVTEDFICYYTELTKLDTCSAWTDQRAKAS